MSAAQAKPQRLTARLLRTMPLPDPRGGKEQRGRVLVVGGSSRVPGAVLLAGIGALRAGAGKLQLATTQEAALPLAVAMPEALVLGLPVTAQGEIARGSPALDQALDGCDAVLVGCGMNPSAAAATLVQRVIRHMGGIAVIDAGALAPDLRAPPGKPFVLTPHAGEMAKLCGREKAQVEQEPHALACALARRARSVLVLQGGHHAHRRTRRAVLGPSRRLPWAGHVRFRRCAGRGDRRPGGTLRRRRAGGVVGRVRACRGRARAGRLGRLAGFPGARDSRARARNPRSDLIVRVGRASAHRGFAARAVVG